MVALLPFLRCVVKDGPDPGEKIVYFKTAGGATESESINPDKIYNNRLMVIEIEKRLGGYARVFLPTRPAALRKSVLVPMSEIEYHR